MTHDVTSTTTPGLLDRPHRLRRFAVWSLKAHAGLLGAMLLFVLVGAAMGEAGLVLLFPIAMGALLLGWPWSQDASFAALFATPFLNLALHGAFWVVVLGARRAWQRTRPHP